MKLTPNRFQDVFERYELPERVVNSTCMLDGELYVGTDTGLVVIGKDGPVSSVPLTSARTISGRDLGTLDLVELLDGCRIRSILRDEQDRLWISTWRSLGLLRYDHGVLTSFATEEGLPSDHVRAVCAAKDGSTVVACTGGVSVIEDDRVKAVYGRDEGIANVEILTVDVAPNGDIIAGTDGGGIYVIDGKGAVRHVGDLLPDMEELRNELAKHLPEGAVPELRHVCDYHERVLVGEYALCLNTLRKAEAAEA